MLWDLGICSTGTIPTSTIFLPPLIIHLNLSFCYPDYHQDKRKEEEKETEEEGGEQGTGTGTGRNTTKTKTYQFIR